jgi:glycosyltransferase involved in cell wall biosynthesis
MSLPAPEEGGPRLALLADASVVHAIRWAEALAARGFAVRLFSLEPAHPSARQAGVAVHALPSAPLPGVLRYPLALPALRRALAEFRPRLVDAHFVPNYGLLGVACGWRPLVVNSWGSDLLLARGAGRRRRARHVLERADCILVDARASERVALALGAPRARLTCLPWGVDLEAYPPGGPAEERRRRRDTWPAAWRLAHRREEFVLASTRHLHPIYDLATLLAAWPQVLRRHAGAALLIAGEGPEALRLGALADRLGIRDSVRFLGRLEAPALAELLAGADLYVSCSLSDTTSISLLEAMSAGALPVVSELEANREWVGEAQGALFPPGEAAALARAVLGLAERRAAWEGMRAAARAVVSERGDRRRAMDRVAALYRELLGE